MKIYTRRGDQGETDLFGGDRLSKDAPRVEAYGAVDELNAFLGCAASISENEDVKTLTQKVQNTLFDLGASLATPDPDHRKKSAIPEICDEDVTELEGLIDIFERELDALRNFVLPGGTKAAAAFHVARTVCRRAERRSIGLSRVSSVDPVVLRYLNRLSDLLFVLARIENCRASVGDVSWIGRQR